MCSHWIPLEYLVNVLLLLFVINHQGQVDGLQQGLLSDTTGHLVGFRGRLPKRLKREDAYST